MVKWKAVRNKASDLYGKGKDAYEKFDEYTDIDLNSNDITPGLTPIGDSGLYVTPNEPADPQDCDRYPDSPYCGGNPFANPFSDPPVSLDPQIVRNNCDTGIKLELVFGYIKLPPVNFVYRNPACRVDLPDPPPPPNNGYSLSALPPNSCSAERAMIIVYPILNQSGISHELGSQVGGYKAEVTNLQYPYINAEGYADYSAFGIDLVASRFVTRTGFFEEEHEGNLPANSSLDIQVNSSVRQRSVNELGIFICDSFTGSYEQIVAWFEDRINLGLYRNQNNSSKSAYFLTDPDINPKWRQMVGRDWIVASQYSTQAFRVLISCSDNKSNSHSPPPPKDKEKCCMTCCDDSLLKILLKKVNRLSEVVAVDSYPGKLVKTKPGEDGKIQSTEIEIRDLRELVGQVYSDLEKTSKVIGIDDYPVTLPKSLIEKYSGSGSSLSQVAQALDALSDAANPDGTFSTTTNVPSLTQMFAWYVERFDEVIGQFEIPIEIKDTDVLKDGDQPATIRLPNIAEAIAEMFMLAFQAQINTEVLINMVTRVMLEGGQDKQQNFISYQLLLSLIDWAGFKTKDVKKDMNLLFTPGKTRLDELLDESKQTVVVQELDEKFGLEIDLMRFRKAASILDSVFFRKINPDGDIKGQIMKYLLNSLDTSKKLDNVKGDDDSDNSFEKFIEDAEVGFTQTPGISDSTNPYGRDFRSRPRIRDLSQNQSNNNSGDA